MRDWRRHPRHMAAHTGPVGMRGLPLRLPPSVKHPPPLRKRIWIPRRAHRLPHRGPRLASSQTSPRHRVVIAISDLAHRDCHPESFYMHNSSKITNIARRRHSGFRYDALLLTAENGRSPRPAHRCVRVDTPNNHIVRDPKSAITPPSTINPHLSKRPMPTLQGARVASYLQ